jgi:Pregnancy-associated plasma protein-A
MRSRNLAHCILPAFSVAIVGLLTACQGETPSKPSTSTTVRPDHGTPPLPRLARRSCGTMEVDLRLLATVSSYRSMRYEAEALVSRLARRHLLFAKRGTPPTIKVVVHVVFHEGSENISDAQINSQIDVLNHDYRKMNADLSKVPSIFASVVADAGVNFQLATIDPAGNPTNGITRTHTDVIGFDDDDAVKDAARGGISAWPSDKYLNIWVSPLKDTLLGYAQFPGGPTPTDGVVVRCTAFGTVGTATAPFNLGRTATHEVGHWLNLYHTFQDGCVGTKPQTCLIEGDRVCDTPAVADPNYGCALAPTLNSCVDHPKDLPDEWMNFMDYPDDACMFMFTRGQAERIAATLSGPRHALIP